jgi:hypothetical protein
VVVGLAGGRQATKKSNALIDATNNKQKWDFRKPSTCVAVVAGSN